MTQPGFGDITNLAAKLIIHVILEQYKQFAYKSNPNRCNLQFYNNQTIRFAIQIILYLLPWIIYLHLVMNIIYKDFFLMVGLVVKGFGSLNEVRWSSLIATIVTGFSTS